MKAMNGSAVPGRRGGRSLIGCVLALAALAAMIVPSIASAAKPPPPPVTSTVLGLGDSLAFGYSQQLYNEASPKGDPAQAFENGYTNDYLKLIKGTENGIQLTNDGCPGETTESFIGPNPALLGGLNFALKGAEEKEAAENGGKFAAVTGENPCAYQEAWNALHKNGTGGPLHHPYVGKSQLEDALGTIAFDAAVGKPVTTITFNIGANDELHTLGKCEETATKEVEAEVAARITKEIGEKLAKGEITPAEIPATVAKLSKEEAENPANKEQGEAKAKACIAKEAPGLFAQISKNTAGILLAIRHGGELGIPGLINYNGRILYQGGYDPFGNVFGTGEVKPGTRELAGVENIIQNKTVSAFGACFTDPELTFNPGNKAEPGRLQRWTNMANFTKFEGKANGPDIHPTPAGYKELAKLLKHEGEKAEAEALCI